MNKFCRLKNGNGFVIYSDNIDDQTVNLIPLSQCDENGNYDPEFICAKEYSYSDIADTDFNRHFLGI